MAIIREFTQARYFKCSLKFKVTYSGKYQIAHCCFHKQQLDKNKNRYGQVYNEHSKCEK